MEKGRPQPPFLVNPLSRHAACRNAVKIPIYRGPELVSGALLPPSLVMLNLFQHLSLPSPVILNLFQDLSLPSPVILNLFQDLVFK
jgi:hypothetical protein